MVSGYVTILSHRRQYFGVVTRLRSSHTSSDSCVYSNSQLAPSFSVLCHTRLAVTNVVFSNGRLDPWSEMGVVDQDRAGAGVKVIMMDQAAHHLDLFFEHPLDPQDVLDARRVEMDMVESWVDQAYQVYRGESGPHESGGDRNVAATGVGRNDAKGNEGKPSWLERAPSLTADW